MVRMGTDTDGAYSASASSSTLPLHSSPTRVSLVGSRPTSKARGTRLRPVTSDYIKTKSRSKTPKAVHKTPFTKDTRSTNELSKGVYPSNFMKKLRHPEMLRGDEKLTHALTKSTSDSTLLHSVDDSVFERFMDAKLKERGLKDSASFVGVFAGLDANADADGLPTSVFESTANDGSQVYQSGPLQHQVGTSFAYQQHINSLMKEYQKSLTEQAALKPSDFVKMPVIPTNFTASIPDPTRKNGPLAATARKTREIASKIAEMDSLREEASQAHMSQNRDSKTDWDGGDMLVAQSIATIRTNDYTGFGDPSLDGVGEEHSSVTGAQYFAPPLPPSNTASIVDFDEVAVGDDEILMYLFLPGQVNMDPGGVGGAELLLTATNAAKSAPVSVGARWEEALSIMRETMNVSKNVCEMRCNVWNSLKGEWKELGGDGDWRDSVNISVLGGRKMYVVVRCMLELEEGLMRVATPVPATLGVGDGRRERDSMERGGEGGSQILAQFPLDPTSMPNIHTERDEVSEKFYAKKKEEWAAIERKTLRSNRKKGGGLSLLGSTDSLTMTEGSMGWDGRGNAGTGGGSTDINPPGGGLLSTLMGGAVKQRGGASARGGVVAGEAQRKSKVMKDMEKGLNRKKKQRETRFREVYGNAVNVYSNLLTKYQYDELFADDQD